MHKKLFVGMALLLSPLLSNTFLPCGSSAPGVLNVGILPGNLPYSDWDPITNTAIGFDPLLITAAAKLLGYDTVNFIGYGNDSTALAALASGAIDVYANSSVALSRPPITTTGVVTDVGQIYSTGGEPLGWQVNISCCGLALQLEAAVSELVENGTYARVLQILRLNGLTTGFILGTPLANSGTGILFEPFPYASSELGTIPTTCVNNDPSVAVMLPATNCISSYLQSVCTPATPFTGATGPNVS